MLAFAPTWTKRELQLTWSPPGVHIRRHAGIQEDLNKGDIDQRKSPAMFRAVFGNKTEGGGKKSQKNAGVEVHMPSIQHRGSNQRATHHHGHNGSQLNRKRLTKGVSISLPSSPLLPRQGDMASSQSCIKFP
ncbi:hypothetical protein AMECASPLE_021134, partial [Ameca splendens]